MRRSISYLCLSVLIGDCLLAGCQSAPDGPSATRKEQDAALADPFSVGPDARSMQKAPGKYDDVDPTDISGGGTSELNKRALQRDWDKVLGR